VRPKKKKTVLHTRLRDSVGRAWPAHTEILKNHPGT